MKRRQRQLAGTVVAVTGGGRGIGAATAAALVRRDARVAIGDIDLAAAERTAGELGGHAIALAVDVADPASVREFLDQVEHALGPLDVLINNAGVMPISAIDEETDAAARRQLDINLWSVIHGSREAIKRMRSRGTGHLVNVASAAGRIGFPGGATYCATKFGVVGFSEAARRELRGSGIEISCVLPAIVRTELSAGLRDSTLIKSVTAEQVAEEIVRVLCRPRFAVYLPRSIGRGATVFALLPVDLGDWLFRQVGGPRLLLDAAQSAARRGYESRVADQREG
jgi:NAD(P)-dependent dehydrogenase (short-subunit alcohol dehydrogenase family)